MSKLLVKTIIMGLLVAGTVIGIASCGGSSSSSTPAPDNGSSVKTGTVIIVGEGS
jgi:hypothetical protein